MLFFFIKINYHGTVELAWIFGEKEALPIKEAEKFFNCSYLDEISLQGLFLRAKSSPKQKNIANNFVTLKRIFSYTVIQPKVTNVEYNVLKDNNMKPLEETSDEVLYKELIKIIDYTNSGDAVKNQIADKLFEIRTKELKYIYANVPAALLCEMKNGYKILDKYLEFISG